MKKITIYKVDTGEIQRVVTCPDDSIELQLQPGEALLEGDSNDETQKVVDGALVDKDPPSTEELNTKVLRQVRDRRNDQLGQTDWTQMPDSPLSTVDKEAWATYRQSLRDLPSTVNNTVTNISDVTFPNPPN
jgi:hypothetical protein